MKAFSHSGRWAGDTLTFNVSRALASAHALVEDMPFTDTKAGLVANLANLEHDIDAMERMLVRQHDVCMNVCMSMILMSRRPASDLQVLCTLLADLNEQLDLFDPLGDDFVSHVIDQLGSAGKEA